MADLKPTYLVHGDDEVKIDAWRARLRTRAQSEGAAASLEVLAGERATARALGDAIAALTLAVGRRYVLVDGVERWKNRDIEEAETTIASLLPETIVVLIATGKLKSGKGPAPARLVKTVERCGGEVHLCEAPRPAALPGWAARQAADLGLSLGKDAAQELVARVGTDQRRLMRELEKLAIYALEGERIDAETIDRLTASDVEVQTYALADAVIDRDCARALRLGEELRSRGEDMMHILFSLLRQIGNAHRAWAMVSAGWTTQEIQSALGVPPFVAKRIVTQAKQSDGERLARALELLAELDYAIRGGANLDAETALTLTIAHAASDRQTAAV